jgi:hypothetical protein
MKRLLFVPVLALVTVGAMAIPAHAKGPVENASGQVVITGPGLGEPIELKGTVRGFAEPGGGFYPMDEASGEEFTALLVGSGLLPDSSGLETPYSGWFVLPPEPAARGPAYELRVELAGDGWSESLSRRLYPYASDRPLVFTPAESVVQTRGVRMLRHPQGLWWSAPPTLLGILRSHGLPLTAPSTPPPPAPPAVPAAHPQGWVMLWTAVAFLGLLLAGVVEGRRRVRAA